MDFTLERMCRGVLHAYGEPFLQYIFALDGELVTLNVLAEQSRQHLQELLQVATGPSFDNTLEANAAFNAAIHFGTSVGRTHARATELRLGAGGSLPVSPPVSDPFLGKLFEYAAFCWPTVTLLCGWHNSFHRLGSPLTRSLNRFYQDGASAALLQDAELSLLFPTTASDDLERAPSTISTEWRLVPETGGMMTTYVGEVINQMLLIAAVRLAALDASWKFESFWRHVFQSVKDYRSFAKGATATFPVLVGIGGLQSSTFFAAPFGRHSLRKSAAIDSHLLGRFGMGSHTITLEIPSRLGRSGQHSSNSGAENAFEIVETETNLIRLALLTDPGTQRYKGTAKYFTRFLSPRGPGGIEIWSASVIETNAPTPEEEFSNEDVARVIAHYKMLHSLAPNIKNFKLPMRRLLQAAGNRNLIEDAVIDAFIAIEALFSPGKGVPKRGEKLSAAVAALIGAADVQRRHELQAKVGDLYNKRSKIVHGDAKGGDLTSEDADEAISIAIDAIRALCNPANSILLPMRASRRNVRLRTSTSTSTSTSQT